MPKKGKGRLIHVSDFIRLEGRITTYNLDNSINRDARKIIYPGANGDPWWNTKQLLVQVKDALDIFEESFPGCIAVLVFDQSLVHASYREGALNAFEMNLNLGGKQEILKETVFPPETKNLELIRTKQEMFITGPNGKRTAKGIKQVLLKRGCLPDI